MITLNSKNLPDMNIAMILEYSMTGNKYNIDEIRRVKELMASNSLNVEGVVGNVELMREDPKCIVQATIVLEQKVEQKYLVSVIMNEKEKTVMDTSCDGCLESAGGCKHTLILLFWLQKNPALPPLATNDSYWFDFSTGVIKCILNKDIQDIRKIRGNYKEYVLKKPEDKHLLDKLLYEGRKKRTRNAQTQTSGDRTDQKG